MELFALRTPLGHRIGASFAVALVILLGSCSDGPGAPHEIPVLLGAKPDTVVRGTGSLILEVRGSGFANGSRVLIDSFELETTFEADTLLLAEMPAAEVDREKGWRSLQVATPAPGGGVSESDSILVANPVPVLDSISSPVKAQGAPEDSVTFYGHALYDGWFVWDGSAAFEFQAVDSTRAVALMPSGLFATGGYHTIHLVQPGPGGGVSDTVLFSVLWPVPSLTAFVPQETVTDGDTVRLRVFGSDLAPTSMIRFGGVDLTTQYISSTELRARVAPSLIATAGNKTVEVSTPAPGGGLSNGLAFGVAQAPPRVTSLAPSTATAGDTGIVVVVTGRGFTPGVVGSLGGADRATAYVSATELHLTVLAADLAVAGSPAVVISDTSTGLVSAPVPIVVLPPSPGLLDTDSLVLSVAALEADPTRDRIWAAIPAGAPSRAGQVVAIDPATATVVDSMLGFGDPRILALSDDGAYLYVGREDAPEIVRVRLSDGARVVLPMPGNGGVLRPDDIVVFDSEPTSILVATKLPLSSPRNTGTFVYEGTNFLPLYAPGHTGSNILARGEWADEFYGVNNETSEFGVRRLRLVPDGVVEEEIAEGLVGQYGVELTSAAGRLYLTNGNVVDQATLTSVGIIPAGNLTVDAALGRVYLTLAGELQVYHSGSLVFLGSVSIPEWTSVGLPVRWGSDGLAARTPTAVIFVRSPLIGP